MQNNWKSTKLRSSVSFIKIILFLKKFFPENMVRGIDEDESVFLSELDSTKRVVKMRMKREEQELIKELAVTQHLAANQPSSSRFILKPSTSKVLGPPKSKQAAFLSTAIKRKST